MATLTNNPTSLTVFFQLYLSKNLKYISTNYSSGRQKEVEKCKFIDIKFT